MTDADALSAKLDRITLLLVALLVVEVFHVLGDSFFSFGLFATLALVGGLVAVFFLALAATL